LTTAGCGDIAPKTVAGRALAPFIMIRVCGIIAVPAGIVTADLAGNELKLKQQPGHDRPFHPRYMIPMRFTADAAAANRSGEYAVPDPGPAPNKYRCDPDFQ